jgi:hypothetical protein
MAFKGMLLRYLFFFLAVTCWSLEFLHAHASSTAQASSVDLTTDPIVQLLGRLTSRDSKIRRAAAKEIERRKDPSAIPGLVELLRFPVFNQYGDATLLLRQLTKQNFDNNWFRWQEWLSQQTIPLPPQFIEWKSALLQLLDPNFGKFLYAEMPLRIRADEIVWGGVKVDGIPALMNPKLIHANEAEYLRGSDVVFGVEINGDARAYPHRLLDSHEMLNDVVGGQPVSLAYCTLCRAGILFDTKVGDRVFTFGSSGLLYRSNKLMYDHQTESLWLTIPGEPVSGKLADSGLKLKQLPVVVTTWERWRKQHPATKVLSLDTGYNRDYRAGAWYGEYFASSELMFPVPLRDTRLQPKDEVFAVLLNGQPKAYALKKLKKQPVVNDRVGNEAIVLLTESKTGAVRAYFRGSYEFRKFDGETAESSDGKQWRVMEAALVETTTGKRLWRASGHIAYWFGWVNFYPRTLLYEP